MTTLEAIRDHLAPFVAPLSVAISGVGAGTSLMTAKANATELFSHLQPIFQNVSPVQAGQDGDLPEALYRLAELGTTEWSGVEVSHVSKFDVSVREHGGTSTYKAMTERVDQLDIALKGVAGFEIVDAAEGYDDIRTAYRTDLAIDICRPLADVIVIELTQDTIDEGFLGKGCTAQSYLHSYAVVHHAVSYTALSDLRDLTADYLNNYRPEHANPLMARSGEAMPTAGGLFAWVDIYTLELTQ